MTGSAARSAGAACHHRLRRILRRRLELGSSGFTTIELLVSMLLIAIIVALITPMYLAMSGSSSQSLSMASANSGIRPALIELQREVTSASELYSPCPSSGTNYSYLHAGSLPSCSAGQSPGGFAVLMYTNVTTGSTTQPTCSQWRVANGVLQERLWSPSSMPATLAFFDTASQVAIRNPSSDPPFQLASATGTGSALLEVTFLLAPQAGRTVVSQVVTSFAAQGVGPYESGASTTSSSTTTTSSSTTTTTTVASSGGICSTTPALPSEDS